MDMWRFPTSNSELSQTIYTRPCEEGTWVHDDVHGAKEGRVPHFVSLLSCGMDFHFTETNLPSPSRLSPRPP